MSKTDGSVTTVDGHAPLPWVAGNNDGYSIWTIWSGCHPSGGGPTGKLIAEVVGDSAETDANAALIVRAVNRDSQFADVVGALEPFASAADAFTKAMPDQFELLVKVDATPMFTIKVGDLRNAAKILSNIKAST